jgi:hypothetical protein
LVNTFEIDPSLVRSGETATIEWFLQLDNSLTETLSGDFTPYDYPCEINGAVDNQPYPFNASASGGLGSVPTRMLTNQSLAVLQCSTFARDDAFVEVVPTLQEI